jgi:hypothetical protein
MPTVCGTQEIHISPGPTLLLETPISAMPREATLLSRTYHSLPVSINRADHFHSGGPYLRLTRWKDSVGSHGLILPLIPHLVIHVYSSTTPTWARKRHTNLKSCAANLQPFINDLPPDESGNPRRLVPVDNARVR